MNGPITTESAYLLELARAIAAPYIALPNTRAVMVMGSAAEGISDCYSDLDIAIYHDELPTMAEMVAVRKTNGSIPKWLVSDREHGTLMESQVVRGVECQFGHATIEAWERD